MKDIAMAEKRKNLNGKREREIAILIRPIVTNNAYLPIIPKCSSCVSK